MLIWRYGGPIDLHATLFCWKFTSSGKIGHYWNYEECCSKQKCLYGLKTFFACRFALTVLYWNLHYDFTSFAFALKLQFVWCGACVMQLPKKSKRKLVLFFLNLRSINFRLTQFWWIFYQVFYIPPKWKWQSVNLTINFFVGRIG